MFSKIDSIVNDNRNLRIGFIVLIFLFIGYKFSDLSLPYYWDELGVYARAILYMYDHELGLLPEYVPPELSRGHPLLFHFIYAGVFRILGYSVFVGHSISMFISILVLSAVYLFAKSFFDEKASLLATFILVVQPIFLAQSTFLLPEMLLALFTVGAIYFYLKNKLIAHIILSSCAIMTKETGIIITVTVLIYESISLLGREISRKQFLKNVFILPAPIYLFVIFLAFQKLQNGWYFFPVHVGTEALNLKDFTIKLDGYFNFIFMRQGRDPWCAALIFGLAAAVLKDKKKLLKDQAINVIIILTIVMLVFSSFNFYMNRYMLMLVIFWPLLVAISIKEIYKLSNKYVRKKKMIIAFIVILVGFIMIMPLFYINAKRFAFDDDMGYKKIVRVQEEAYKWLTNNTKESDELYGNFQMMIAAADPRLGYISDNRIKISAQYNDSAKYAVIVSPGNIDYAFPIEHFVLIKIFEDGFANVKIYKKIE